MENSDVLCESAKRHNVTLRDNKYIKMRCKPRVDYDSIGMRRQQLVLQAMAATCSVDSTSHESNTEMTSDLGILYANENNNITNYAQSCDFTLCESHTNASQRRDFVSLNGEIPLATRNNEPRRFVKWNIKIKTKTKTKEKRRRRRQ